MSTLTASHFPLNRTNAEFYELSNLLLYISYLETAEMHFIEEGELLRFLLLIWEMEEVEVIQGHGFK